jgi:hypothetical protein
MVVSVFESICKTFLRTYGSWVHAAAISVRAAEVAGDSEILGEIADASGRLRFNLKHAINMFVVTAPLTVTYPTWSIQEAPVFGNAWQRDGIALTVATSLNEESD